MDINIILFMARRYCNKAMRLFRTDKPEPLRVAEDKRQYEKALRAAGASKAEAVRRASEKYRHGRH